jgi:hypothetical protein
LTAMVLPSKSLARMMGEALASRIACVSLVPLMLVAPPAINLKSKPSTCACYSEITLVQPNCKSPEVTPCKITAPPAIGIVSSSSPSALK